MLLGLERFRGFHRSFAVDIGFEIYKVYKAYRP